RLGLLPSPGRRVRGGARGTRPLDLRASGADPAGAAGAGHFPQRLRGHGAAVRGRSGRASGAQPRPGGAGPGQGPTAPQPRGVAGFLVPHPDREPPAQVMAQLTRILRERQVPAVFVEPQVDARLAETLAREAGVRVGVLYTDSLTADVPTYVAMMRANAQTLVELLR